jgi:hypothetical protein
LIQAADGVTNRIVFRKFLVFFFGIFLIGSLITVYALLNIAGTNDKQNWLKLEDIKRDLEKEQKELKVSIEFLGSPERIESLAVSRFKMVPVTGDRVFIVRMKPSGTP